METNNHAVVGPQMSLRNELDLLYSEKMAGLKKKFLYSLQNTPLVAWELHCQGVLKEEEMQSILSNPIRQHQKEALFQVVSHKKFSDIDRIMTTLDSTGNDSLRWIMDFVKTQMLETFPSSIDAISKPHEQCFEINGLDAELGAERWPERGNYLTRSERKIRRPGGIKAFLKEKATFAFDSGNSFSDVSVTNVTIHPEYLLVHQAATEGDSDILEQLFKLKPELSPHAADPESGRTPLHAAVLSPSRQNALKCVKLLIARFMKIGESMELDLEEKQCALKLYVNAKDRQGLTVMHLAAEAEYIEVIKYLYDNHRCDIFIRSKDGFTPLDVMYQKTPEAVVHFLNGALPTAYGHGHDAGNHTLEIDFSTVIGRANAKDRHRQSETDMLAQLIFQNPEAAKIILPHIIVRTFLDLKWQKMKFWLYASIVVQALLLLVYTGLVIQIFLVDCPYTILHEQHQEDMNATTKKILDWWRRSRKGRKDVNVTRSLLKYVLGDLMEIEWSELVVRIRPSHPRKCYPGMMDSHIHIFSGILISLFAIFSIFIIYKEIGKVYLLSKIFFHGRRKRFSIWSNAWIGITSYLKDIENIFQIIFLVLLLFQTTLVFDRISELHYTAGALNIVVAWSLMLMHVGKIYGLGTYVQILGKVIKVFLKIMGTYLVLIIAFAIAFSIMFPEHDPFKTLPRSFSRVIIMMTGELDYTATFYRNTTLVKPLAAVPVSGHILFMCFVLLLCVILINLLIGLTVNNIERGKSKVILRSIQIEKLYIMENALFCLNCVICWVRNAMVSLYDSSRCASVMYFDIFVVKPEENVDSFPVRKGLQGMVVVKSMKRLPKALQKEIRAMAEDVSQYVSTYLKK